MKPRITNQETIFDAQWLKLVRVDLLIRGKARQWVYCTRKKTDAAPDGNADAVVIVPFVQKSDEVRVVLIREYRAPLKDYQIAFPAGLLDDGELPTESAERELLEETGYRVKVHIKQSPPLAASAGLTDETFQYAFVEAEAAGKPQLEDSEESEVLLLNLEEVRALLKTNQKFCGRTWPLLDQSINQNKFPL